MQQIEQKLIDANTNFANALNALVRVRQDYESGVGNTLAETMQNSNALHGLIDEQKRASQAARDALKIALRSSNAATTPETKAALTARRNADDLIDEYAELLTEADFRLVEVTIAASSAAQSYESAYSTACAAHIERAAYTALARAGKAIAHAIAMGGGEIIQKELERLAKELRLEAHQSRVEQLGSLNFGVLSNDDRMSSAEVSLTQRVMGGDIPGSALDNVIDKSGRTTSLTRAFGTIRDSIGKVLAG